MVSDAASRFRKLLAERTCARSQAPNGLLPLDEEGRFVDDLELCWEKMSDEERQEAEREAERDLAITQAVR